MSSESEDDSAGPAPAPAQLENVYDSVREKIRLGQYLTVEHPSKGRGGASPVWERFYLVVEKPDDNNNALPNSKPKQAGFAICKDARCAAVYKYSSRGTGNTNLKNHKCKKRFDNSESQKSFVEAKSLARSTSSKAVTKFCIEGRRPPYMISEKPFQHLAQVYIDIGVEFGRVRASDIIPHRTTISRNVEDHANEIRRSLHPEFLKAINDNVCASTVDMWTESIHKFHFMAMTFQYFVIEDVTKEWKLKSKLFFMTPFHKSSTAVNLKEHLLQCCAERGFPEEVVMKLKFVTDNGADLVLALYEFDRIYCYAHYLNVRLESAFKLKVYKVQLFTSEAQDVIDAVVKAALHLKNKKLLSAEYAKVMPKGQKRGPFPSKIPLLRLFYRDFSQVKETLSAAQYDLAVEKESLIELVTVLEPVEKILASCGTDIPPSKNRDLQAVLVQKPSYSSFQLDLVEKMQREFRVLQLFSSVADFKGVVTYFKQNPALMNELPKSLKQCCETRWNSLHTTLHSLLENYDEVRAVLVACGEQGRAAKLDRDTLKMLVSLLLPFKIDSEAVQACKTPTLQLCLPSYSLLLELNEPNVADSPEVAIVRSNIHRELSSKSPITMTHKIATFLWPEFRQLSMLDIEEVEEVKAAVRAKFCNAPPPAAVPAPNPAAGAAGAHDPDGAEQPEPGPPAAKQRKVAASSRYAKWSAKKENYQQPGDEIDLYLSEPIGDDSNLLLWWQQRELRFPQLSRIAREVLCIPATNTDSERTFSGSKILLNELRNSMDPNSVDHHMVAYRNAEYDDDD